MRIASKAGTHGNHHGGCNYEDAAVEELSLKMGDEVLRKIMKQDVLNADENTLAEELLFMENTTVTYNSNTLVIKDLLIPS